EIRTPMNGMLVMAELLSVGGLSPRLQRYADVIVKSGNGLLAIINDILDFSKIEAGKLELESIPVDPRRLVDDTLQLFSERAQSANLEIAAYIARDVPRQIIADPVRMGQVLTNLVNNALKFTETGGVMVLVEAADCLQGDDTHAGLRFSVRDTGIGIPADKLATIFDAFAQADQSTTRQFGGTGIGLSICKRLIEAMDGHLAVESTEGVGSTFFFEAAFSVYEAAELAAPADTTVTALVTLDEGITCDALVRTLGDWRVDVVLASDTPPATPCDIAFRDLSQLDASDDTAASSLPNGLPTVAIGKFGDTRGDALVQAGRIVRLLDRPLSTVELAELIEVVIVDPENLSVEGLSMDTTQVVANRAPFAGLHILAADDSPVNREVLSEVLKRLEVTFTMVEDGREAVEAVKNATFDLIFMDGSMPEIDGFAATRQIRDWEEAHNVEATPIVALTAHVVGEKGDLWRDAGMSDFVTKPFSLATIEACLRRWAPTAETSETPPPDATAANDAGCLDAADTPLLDPDVLGSIREIQAPGDNLIGRIIGLYIEHAPATLEQLRTSLETASAVEIAELAHALKSLSRNVGAVRVGNLADDIENAARDRGHKPSDDTSSALEQALDETITELRALDQVAQADAEVAA
ncbi:MAG: response regulator, partial [Hyphomicrobiaceae bacterium]